jgi:hypothetical protein
MNARQRSTLASLARSHGFRLSGEFLYDRPGWPPNRSRICHVHDPVATIDVLTRDSVGSAPDSVVAELRRVNGPQPTG